MTTSKNLRQIIKELLSKYTADRHLQTMQIRQIFRHECPIYMYDENITEFM